MGRVKRTYRAIFWLLIAVFLSISCASGLFYNREPLTDRMFFSDKAIILDLPFESQKKNNLCGLAAVNMITEYYKILLTDKQRKILASEADKNNGISGAVLKSILEDAGYYVAVFPGTIDNEVTGIYYHINKNRPLIIMSETEEGMGRHYSLLVGYDPVFSYIVLLDPGRGRIVMDKEKFYKKWEQANRFTLLAVPSQATL